MAVDRRAAGWGFAVLALCASCRFGEFVADAGPSDGMTSDAQLVVDGATLDAASDATVFDGAPVDAMGSPDAMGIPDAAQPDAMVALPDAMAPLPDAMVAPPDAGPPDAGLPDAGPPDAGPADAGSHPMGPLGEGLSTLVGDDVADLLNGSREFARFNNPVNVVVGPDGDIFVADFDNGAIRRVTPTGETITLVREPNFSRPFGMAFTPDGSLYVQTDRNSLGQATGALWRVDVDTGELFLERDNSGRWRAMASLSDGRLVVADSLAHVVRIYDPILKSLGHLAGEVGQAGHVDGIGTAARFHEVRDLVVTATDEVLVADSLNHAIRHITLGGVVTTVAGDGTAASVDGPALTASINRPSGLAIQPSGVLYIGEFDSGRVRRLASGELSTIAGSAPGFADSTDPLLGQIFSAEGMDYAEPNLYLSDGNRGEDGPFHRVRRIVIVPEG